VCPVAVKLVRDLRMTGLGTMLARPGDYQRAVVDAPVRDVSYEEVFWTASGLAFLTGSAMDVLRERARSLASPII
jgi:hypothetical protein